MKFVVPNYSCLQTPWLGDTPPDPRSLCPLSSTEFVEPPPTPLVHRRPSERHSFFRYISLISLSHWSCLLLTICCSPGSTKKLLIIVVQLAVDDPSQRREVRFMCLGITWGRNIMFCVLVTPLVSGLCVAGPILRVGQWVKHSEKEWTSLIHSHTRQVYFDSNCAFTCVLQLFCLYFGQVGRVAQSV